MPGRGRTRARLLVAFRSMATGRSGRFRVVAFAPLVACVAAVTALVCAGCGARCATSVSTTARDARGVGAARCERSCPARAEVARRAGGACACAPGLDPLLGACVTPAEAAAFCGPTATWDGHACASRACPASAPDAATGACVPSLRLRSLALAALGAHEASDDREARSGVPEDRAVRCHDGQSLAVRDDQVACLPDAALCARGSIASGGACAPPPPCAVGEVTTAGRCVPLVTPGGAEDPFAIDVGAWATALLGPDGGDGTAIACGPLAASPGAFGVAHGARGSVRVAVDLRFPDNDVTRLVLRVSATDVDTHRPVPPAAARVTRLAVEPLAALLRALGGAASSASIARTVLCPLDGGTAPAVSPSGSRQGNGKKTDPDDADDPGD